MHESVDQNKFVPLLRERDLNGAACLPVHICSRKYIDFSDPDLEADAYDQLLRNIFERPRRRKPILGRPPSHIFEDSPTPVTSAQKAKRFREMLASGKGKPSVVFENFSDEFVANLEDLRVTFTRNAESSWCDLLRENISHSLAHRDVFVDVVRTGTQHMEHRNFTPLILGLLERILPFRERPEPHTGAACDASQDNYRFINYELFLYTVAAFIAAKKFDEARALIDYRYVAPRRYGGDQLEGHDFTDFNERANSLEDICSQQGSSRRLSVMADLLHDRADRKDTKYSELLQADVVLCLATKGRDWFPRSLIYSRGIGKLELFLRAVTTDGFQPLGVMIGAGRPQEMLEMINSDRLRSVWQGNTLWSADLTLDALNIEELTHAWMHKRGT